MFITASFTVAQIGNYSNEYQWDAERSHDDGCGDRVMHPQSRGAGNGQQHRELGRGLGQACHQPSGAQPAHIWVLDTWSPEL